MQRSELKTEIKFGSFFNNHLVHIWNLCITYPTCIIYLWEDYVLGAFRHVKYHPSVASVFSFAIFKYLFIPMGQTFASKTSPPEYETLAQAHKMLARFFSKPADGPHLALKHKAILDLIKWEKKPQSTELVQAASDSIHYGISLPGGKPSNTEHNPFVDDTLIAEIKEHMPWQMAASIEALFIIFRVNNKSCKISP